MPVKDFLSLQATVAQPDASDDDEEMGVFGYTTHYLHVLQFIVLEDNMEFIADDETLDVASNVSHWSPLFFEDDDTEEDLEQIAADINAHNARSHPQH